MDNKVQDRQEAAIKEGQRPKGAQDYLALLRERRIKVRKVPQPYGQSVSEIILNGCLDVPELLAHTLCDLDKIRQLAHNVGMTQEERLREIQKLLPTHSKLWLEAQS